MNDPLPHILADSTDEMIKLIFGGVFVLIWIVGGLMSAAKKKPQTRTPEKSWDEIFRELSGEPKRPSHEQTPPPPPVPVRFDSAPTPQRQVQRPATQPPRQQASAPPSGPAVRKKLRRRQSVAAPTPPAATPIRLDVPHAPVTEVATEFVHAVAGDISRTEIGTGKAIAHRTARTPAADLRKLLRPENLRHQFILTEILKPPKALRQEL